jgi:uncharacterized protein (TIGR00159 family)
MQYLVERDPYELARDALDLVITYYLFYRVALVLRGTRAIQVVFGLAAVFVLYLVAQLLRLDTLLTLLSAVLSSAILIGVVVFQNDIRRGLMRVGAGARFGSGQSLEAKVIDNVVEAATILARHRIGAIITFEQDANLDEFVGSNTGLQIDAAVTPQLLVTLFIPEGINEFHDGSVVIRDLRIAKAGVFFPMPETRVTDDSFGSRHRAAMGITEETDAVVVVVSEERGSISFCFNGNIIPNLDGPRLKAALEGVFVPKNKARTRPHSMWARLLRKTAAAPAQPASDEAPASRRAIAPKPPGPRPLRKNKETTTEDTPAPLRKKKLSDDLDETAESQPNAPEPLRKRRSSDGGNNPRRSSNPPPNPSTPPGATPGDLRTPLRHMTPSPESTRTGSPSDPPPPMPVASATHSDGPNADAIDSQLEPAPLSTQRGPGRPMPRASEPPGKRDDQKGDAS